jgi:signal transduction histidine kinase
MTRQSDTPSEFTDSSDRGSVERFLGLARELLTSETHGVLRRDFLPSLSERFRRFSASDAVELWVKEGSRKHFRCCVTDSARTPSACTLVQSSLGQEIAPPTGGRSDEDMEILCRHVIRGSVDRTRPCFTKRGSFWTGDAFQQIDLGRTGSFRSGGPRLPGSYKSLALIPIGFEGECVGLLQLKSRKKGFFSSDDLLLYEDISGILGITLSHQYVEIELRERIKEIECLYGIARVMAPPDASFDDVLQGIVDLLPPAWLHPEIACARIYLNGRSYVTEGYRPAAHRQVAEVIVNGENVGFVELAYTETRIALDEGPFLAEERSLINSVAREIAIFYERTRAEAEKASLHDQLRHADRLATIGQLAAGVAHELNEPLANVLGLAQLAKRTEDLPGQVEKDLKSIETASLQAREIIKKLMMFARQLPPRKAPVNLNEIVEEGLYFFEARCVKAGIELNRRHQVLVNLVVNAIQAMRDGGTLTVETRAGKRAIRLCVEDTGIGMSEELRKQIFLPFFTTKDLHEGTGLGLAVVHGIVTSHGGTITVRTKEGKGTRFVIRLPLKARKEA